MQDRERERRNTLDVRQLMRRSTALLVRRGERTLVGRFGPYWESWLASTEINFVIVRRNFSLFLLENKREVI